MKRGRSLSREEAFGEGAGQGGELQGGFEEGEDEGEWGGALGLDGDAFAGLGVFGGSPGDGAGAVRADLDDQAGNDGVVSGRAGFYLDILFAVESYC